jgi:hypothetical protein
MSRITYALLVLATGAAITALILVGQRVAPPQQAANSVESRQACKLEAPEPFRPAAAKWCAIGLFSSVTITADKEHVIAVLQFSPNGGEAWQMQSSGLINEFRTLTDGMAPAASGRNVSVDVHSAADKRIAACARLATETTAACEVK